MGQVVFCKTLHPRYGAKHRVYTETEWHLPRGLPFGLVAVPGGTLGLSIA